MATDLYIFSKTQTILYIYIYIYIWDIYQVSNLIYLGSDVLRENMQQVSYIMNHLLPDWKSPSQSHNQLNCHDMLQS